MTWYVTFDHCPRVSTTASCRVTRQTNLTTAYTPVTTDHTHTENCGGAMEKPKADKHLTSKGLPKIGGVSVPGLKNSGGTPGWLSRPAKAAARKAK